VHRHKHCQYFPDIISSGPTLALEEVVQVSVEIVQATSTPLFLVYELLTDQKEVFLLNYLHNDWNPLAREWSLQLRVER
jgi:hypothetical protein